MAESSPSPNGTEPPTLTVSQALRLHTQALRRLNMTRDGVTFEGRRDLYKTLGYERDLTYAHYYEKYERCGIAKRLIDALVDATWRQDPILREKDKPEGVTESPWETAFEALVARLDLWNTIIRLDRQASLGHFGVLVLGTRYDTDLAALATELPRARVPEDLVSLQPFSEEHTTIGRLVTTPSVPEFGKPGAYWIDFSRKQTSHMGPDARLSLPTAYLRDIEVHASRVIHLAAEGALEDDIYGPPGLQAVWNYLDNLDKVLGGSAEMFWQDAKRRFVLSLRDGAIVDDEHGLSDEVEEFVHELRNFLRVQGMDVIQLTGTIPDPRGNFESNIESICATKKMPKRILLGTERGELASDQDEQNWLAGTILTRQMRYAQPFLRRLMDRLIKYNYLPPVPNGYDVEWPPARVPTEEERANVALQWARTIATLAGAMNSPQEVLPLKYMLTDILEWDADEVEAILDEIGRQEAMRATVQPRVGLPSRNGNSPGSEEEADDLTADD